MSDAAAVVRPVKRLSAIIGAGIFLGALLLRLVGVGWGLKNDLHNQSYHPDELPIFAFSQQIEPAKGNFVPGVYNYGTLYLSLLRVASDVTTAYTGSYDKSPDSYWAWVSRCHLAGRIVNCLAAAGTALLMFLMMRRFTTLLGAGLAGAVLAVAPAFVEHSRFQTVDVLATFLITASAYCALLLLPPKTVAESDSESPIVAPGLKFGLKLAMLSGAFAGLSAGTKYSGVIAIFTLYAALFLAKRKTAVVEAIAGTLALFVAFVIATPGFLLDHDKFMADFTFEAQHVATAHGYAFLGTPPGLIFHLMNLSLGLGAILALCCIGGLGWAAFKKQPWAFALLAFLVPYYLVIGKAEVKFIRYTFPLYVGLAAGFGWAMSECQKQRGLGKIGFAIGLCGIGGLDYGGLRSAAMLTVQMVQEDSRDSSARYIRSIATPGTRVGFARDPWYWSVPLEPNGIMPPSVPMAKRLETLRSEAQPPVDFVTGPDGSPTVFDPTLVTKLRPEIIAYTSIEAGDLQRLADVPGLLATDKSAVDNVRAFTAELTKAYSLDRMFGSGGLPVEDMQYINPVVYVWKLKTKP